MERELISEFSSTQLMSFREALASMPAHAEQYATPMAAGRPRVGPLAAATRGLGTGGGLGGTPVAFMRAPRSTPVARAIKSKSIQSRGLLSTPSSTTALRRHEGVRGGVHGPSMVRGYSSGGLKGRAAGQGSHRGIAHGVEMALLSKEGAPRFMDVAPRPLGERFQIRSRSHVPSQAWGVAAVPADLQHRNAPTLEGQQGMRKSKESNQRFDV